MRYKSLIIIIFLLLIPSLTLASQVPTKYTFDMLPSPTFDNNTAFVNASQFWNTITLGPLDDANSAQFDNIGGTLTIDESHIELIGNAWWLRLDGTTTPTANINWGGFDITNLGNITIGDNIFFGDTNHFLRKGISGFTGLGDSAFVFRHVEEQPLGEIPFMVVANKTDSNNDAVLISMQIGLNESNSILGNSWFIVVNNLTNNLTEYHKCFLVAGLLNKTLRVQCDSPESGADLIVQDDIQSFGTMFADGGIRAETLVDFIMNGEDVNIQGGALHIFDLVTFEQGVVEGNEVTTFIETFGGGLGSFTNLQDDLGNWFVTSNILCDDGDCANAIGISGVGNIIMEANISTVNINSTSLNFIYSLTNMLGANDFEVTVNNNVGSGEVSIFTDSTNDVIKSSQSIALPSSMTNQPIVSVRFNCDVTNTNRQCFVDTIGVNGTAIATTLTNVSGFNSVWKMSDGALASDGFPETGIFFNASGNAIVIRGNMTIFENVIEQDLNVTSSITLNSVTLSDWGDIPDFLLLNGSSVMGGDIQTGAFGINGSGNISTDGNITADTYFGDWNGGNVDNGIIITDTSNPLDLCRSIGVCVNFSVTTAGGLRTSVGDGWILSNTDEDVAMTLERFSDTGVNLIRSDTSKGTTSTPTAVTINIPLMRLEARGNNGSSQQTAGRFEFIVGANVAGGAFPTRARLQLSNSTGDLVNVIDIDVSHNIQFVNNVTADYGFFNFIGSSISRITKGWFTTIDIKDSAKISNWTINNSGQFYDDGSRTYSLELNATHTIMNF